MKKIFFSLTLAFLALRSQSHNLGDSSLSDHKLIIAMRIGPEGAMWLGGNYALRKQWDIHYFPTIGFSAGASIQYAISKKSSLLGEINFDRKGNTLIAHNVGNSVSVVDSPNYNSSQARYGTFQSNSFIDYISIPLILKFKFNKKKVGFFVNIGSYQSYLINYTYKTFFLDEETSGKVNIKNSGMHRFDCGLVTGLGWDIQIKRHFHFSIEFRNSLGIRPMYQGENIFSGTKNESFALLFGIGYKI